MLKAGVFKSSTLIGEGTINLLDLNETKCILGDKQKKTAILYFKISLIWYNINDYDFIIVFI